MDLIDRPFFIATNQYRVAQLYGPEIGFGMALVGHYVAHDLGYRGLGHYLWKLLKDYNEFIICNN